MKTFFRAYLHILLFREVKEWTSLDMKAIEIIRSILVWFGSIMVVYAITKII